jgi:hypothetical protein
MANTNTFCFRSEDGMCCGMAGDTKIAIAFQIDKMENSEIRFC